MGRTFSDVRARALAGSAAGATQTFITPSFGASQDSHLPSGLSRPAARLGLPNSLVRSISGGAVSGAANEAVAMAAAATAQARRRRRMAGSQNSWSDASPALSVRLGLQRANLAGRLGRAGAGFVGAGGAGQRHA